jgi:hypothetical protein
MEEEYDALITNNTWDLVPQLVGSNVIQLQWYTTIAQGSLGSSWLHLVARHCVR